MDKLPMCRICLAENVKMHVITNTLYQEIYQRLTMMPFETKDSRPLQVCYICCAQLRNSYELRKNCLRSEELFTQMLQTSAPKLEELLESITNKRLSVKHSVIQIDIGPELLASSDSEDNVECIESIQVKIEPEEEEDAVDLDSSMGLGESSSYDLPKEEDPLCTTKVEIKNEKDTDVPELRVLPGIDVPDYKPLISTKDTVSTSPISRSSPPKLRSSPTISRSSPTISRSSPPISRSSPPILRSSSTTVQQLSPQAPSTSGRTDAAFVSPSTTAETLEPTDTLKTILLKRKLNDLIKARTFAAEKHAFDMEIMRIQKERMTETLKHKMLIIQCKQKYLEIANKIRKLDD